MYILELLGGLSLESQATTVPSGARQRRRLTLLVLSAFGRERGISREKLQAYLWPESSTERARHALDQLLYATRRDFGSDAVASVGSELRLNPSLFDVDLWRFDDAIRGERWADAVELYAGPLLEGIHLIDCAEFERLVDGERSRRESEFLMALESLAAEAKAGGNLSEAVYWCRRRVAVDPLSLPATLELMRALLATGDRAAAVKLGRVYQQLVRQTLEIEPDDAIEAFLSEISQPRAESSEETPLVPASSAREREPAPIEPPRPPATTTDAPRRLRWRRSAPYALLLGVVATVVALVAPRVHGSGSSTRAASKALETNDRRARELYLRGRASWNKRTKEGLEDAVVKFRLAIEQDPMYAAAYTGLADAYAMLGYFGFEPGDAMFPKARAAADRALELDPNAGEAYAALGQALAWQHAWSDAERAYVRALELTPNDATVHQWYALLLSYVGRAHEAAVHTGIAARLDPLSVQINNMHGMMLYYDGDLAGALRQYDHTVVNEPDSAWVHENPWVLTNFARVAAVAGRHEQALRLAKRAVVGAPPGHPRAVFEVALVNAVSGNRDEARRAYARADSSHPHYAYYHAWLDAVLGDLDSAYYWLDRVDQWGLPALVSLNNDPSLAKLRADPRFDRIRRRLALPAR